MIKKLIDFFRTILESYPLLTTMLIILWNLSYAVFNGVLGFLFASRWFMTMCAYYAILGTMRLAAVNPLRNGNETSPTAMRRVGFGMIPLGLALLGMTVITINEHLNPSYNYLIMTVIAVYTLALVIWSIRNIIKAHREKTITLFLLRATSLASAIGSVLSLERRMIGTFGDAASTSAMTAELVSGLAAFLLLTDLGIRLIAQSKTEE